MLARAHKAARMDDAKTYREALKTFLDLVHKEAFPGPQRPADVGLLMKKMFVNMLTRKSFNAGWVAAGKVVPKGEEE